MIKLIPETKKALMDTVITTLVLAAIGILAIFGLVYITAPTPPDFQKEITDLKASVQALEEKNAYLVKKNKELANSNDQISKQLATQEAINGKIKAFVSSLLPELQKLIEAASCTVCCFVPLDIVKAQERMGEIHEGLKYLFIDVNPLKVGHFLNITTPGTLRGGELYKIEWESGAAIESVDIEYRDGLMWYMIVNGYQDTGFYSWKVPNISAPNARLWIKGWCADGNLASYSKGFVIEKAAGTK